MTEVKKRVLVTGGGGFLGSYVCKELLASGYDVVSFNRSGSEELSKLNVDVRMGDICNLKSLKSAMQGCDSVIHTAAIAGIWGKWKKYYQINVEGTKNVVQAMKELGIKTLVHTSSPSVVFNGKSICGADESIPYTSKNYAPYPVSKKDAEKFVLAECKKGDIQAVVLRPHIIWGPGDPHFTPKLKSRAENDRLRRVGTEDYKVDVIYVENAALAHRQAMEGLMKNPQLNGRIYFLGQEKPIETWSFIDKLLTASGINGYKPRVVPRALAIFAGSMVENVYRLTRKFDQDPPMTKFLALQFGTSHYFDHGAAERDFGYRPKYSLDEAFKRLSEVV